MWRGVDGHYSQALSLAFSLTLSWHRRVHGHGLGGLHAACDAFEYASYDAYDLWEVGVDAFPLSLAHGHGLRGIHAC